jgi:hypothetical protein
MCTFSLPACAVSPFYDSHSLEDEGKLVRKSPSADASSPRISAISPPSATNLRRPACRKAHVSKCTHVLDTQGRRATQSIRRGRICSLSIPSHRSVVSKFCLETEKNPAYRRLDISWKLELLTICSNIGHHCLFATYLCVCSRSLLYGRFSFSVEQDDGAVVDGV